MSRSFFRLAVLVLALLAAPAYAGPGGSRLLDLDRSHGCELSIASAGKAMLLRASGLIPGEAYRFTLTNGDMKPVAFSAYADSQGSLIQYYVPFRFGQDGGTVRVSVAAARCSLAAQADWDRGVATIR